MKKKNILIAASLIFLILSLTACAKTSKRQTDNSTSLDNPYTFSSSSQTQHENIRININQVVVASASNSFQGGTNLDSLKTLFGEPNSYEQIPAGDVTLDSYTWTFDDVTVNVKLYDDSTISRSISDFIFVRDNTITIDHYNSLTDGMSYQNAISILGEPDVFSEVSSSDGIELQAVWSSGIKSKLNNATITLTFTDGSLTKKTKDNIE